jgi:hypothetical protein
VGEARAAIAEPMKRWGLEDLIPTTELLVSELVTNAVRYSRGDVTLRLVNERALVCEVLDNSAALPRLRQANGEDENGRGLQVVRQLSQRWGARRTPTGKVVWCEQPLPGGPGPEADWQSLHLSDRRKRVKPETRKRANAKKPRKSGYFRT